MVGGFGRGRAWGLQLLCANLRRRQYDRQTQRTVQHPFLVADHPWVLSCSGFGRVRAGRQVKPSPKGEVSQQFVDGDGSVRRRRRHCCRRASRSRSRPPRGRRSKRPSGGRRTIGSRRTHPRPRLEALGPVPLRAAVGHRARGLLGRRRLLGLLPARPRAQPRLPLGRGRPARHLRSRVPAVLRAGAVERRRSDPQGAPVRPDRPRGQPRRGRQGALLLPRLHADALVPARRSTSIRSGDFPTRALSRRTAGAGATSASSSSPTPASSTTDRYFDVTLEYAKAAPDDICSSRSPSPTAARTAAPLHAAADAVVPQHLVVGARRARGTARGRQAVAGGGRRRPRSTRRTRRWAGFVLPSRPSDGAVPSLLFTENETNTERLFGTAERRAVREGRVSRLRRRRARRRGESGAAGDEGGGALPARTSRPGARCGCGCGWRM